MTPTASSVMSRRVAVVAPDATCAQAYGLLRKQGGRCLVVVASSGDGGVVGLVTERALVAASTDAQVRRVFPPQLTVRDVMTSAPWCVSPSASLEELCDDFLANHLEAAPVVADDGELVGLVTTVDLLRTLQERLPVPGRERAA